jgi:hypothetical protein
LNSQLTVQRVRKRSEVMQVMVPLARFDIGFTLIGGVGRRIENGVGPESKWQNHLSRDCSELIWKSTNERHDCYLVRYAFVQGPNIGYTVKTVDCNSAPGINQYPKVNHARQPNAWVQYETFLQPPTTQKIRLKTVPVSPLSLNSKMKLMISPLSVYAPPSSKFWTSLWIFMKVSREVTPLKVTSMPHLLIP